MGKEDFFHAATKSEKSPERKPNSGKENMQCREKKRMTSIRKRETAPSSRNT
jgi:hypothetical protein